MLRPKWCGVSRFSTQAVTSSLLQSRRLILSASCARRARSLPSQAQPRPTRHGTAAVSPAERSRSMAASPSRLPLRRLRRPRRTRRRSDDTARRASRLPARGSRFLRRRTLMPCSRAASRSSARHCVAREFRIAQRRSTLSQAFSRRVCTRCSTRSTRRVPRLRATSARAPPQRTRYSAPSAPQRRRSSAPATLPLLYGSSRCPHKRSRLRCSTQLAAVESAASARLAAQRRRHSMRSVFASSKLFRSSRSRRLTRVAGRRWAPRKMARSMACTAACRVRTLLQSSSRAASAARSSTPAMMCFPPCLQCCAPAWTKLAIARQENATRRMRSYSHFCRLLRRARTAHRATRSPQCDTAAQCARFATRSASSPSRAASRRCSRKS